MKSKNILVLRFSALGDVAMLYPVFYSLSKKYPEHNITLATRAKFTPIFDDLENIKTIGIDFKKYKSIFGIIRLFYFLRKQKKWDYVVDCHDVLRTKFLKILFRMSGTPFIVFDKGKVEKEKIIRTKEVEYLKSGHERYRDAICRIEDIDFELLPIELNNIDYTEQKIHIGIAPFSAKKSKQLPLKKTIRVVERLLKKENVHVYIFGGGKQEYDWAVKLHDRHPTRVSNYISYLSHNNELPLMKKMNLMVAMDSANGHLAANLGVPVVTIWGSTHPCFGFSPYGQPIENSILPDEKSLCYPHTVFGNVKCNRCSRLRKSLETQKIFYKVKEVLTLKGIWK